MTFAGAITRIGIAAALAVSGISHAYLYIHGYRHIPTIGTAFVAQASVSFAVAALILVGGPAWLRWVAAMLAGGSLVRIRVVTHRRAVGGLPGRGSARSRVRIDSFWGIVATR